MSDFEYSQIYAILLMLGNSYIDKIPKVIVDDIILKMDKDNIPIYDIKDITENIDISEKVIDYINMFSLKYWD